jgi:phosphocarrier protein
MVKVDFIITNSQGLHARPATKLVNETVKYDSDIFLVYEGIEINLKSIMMLMSLGINSGSVIEVKVEGKDEEIAIEGITNFILTENLGKVAS